MFKYRRIASRLYFLIRYGVLLIINSHESVVSDWRMFMPEDAMAEEARRMHDYLKSRGFEAGESAIRFVPEFDLGQLREAHYGSTYDEPKPLRIELAKDLVLRVVVEMSRAVYETVTEFQTQNPFGCYRFPDWYVEGWLLKSGFDPYGEVVRVRLYLDSTSTGFQEGYVQRIPKEPDVDGIIQYVDSQNI